jgi:drug/metabolite transporter (DMT)-like permease
MAAACAAWSQVTLISLTNPFFVALINMLLFKQKAQRFLWPTIALSIAASAMVSEARRLHVRSHATTAGRVLVIESSAAGGGEGIDPPPACLLGCSQPTSGDY